MFEFLSYGSERLQAFMLVNFRVSGILLAAPILGRASLPLVVKLGLAVTLAIFMMPLVLSSPLPAFHSIIDLTTLGIKELLIGILIGLIMKLLFYAAQAAGSIVGFQSGLSIANIIDPTTKENTNMVGQIWFLIASVIFLAINGHHLVISGLADSYRLVPLGTVAFGADAADLIMRITTVLFGMALKFAAPVLVTVFLVDVTMGVLARTIPQMNIFVIGIPIKIAASLIMLAASLPVFAWVLARMTEFLDRHMGTMLMTMTTGN
ncbi:MAG: flagellar biosynthetic protein FliR [candidate division Zixibacteria bacterium]|nr:flagellar biosynthetic protein FliR [candidate division Zixibacteria bacterium]